MYAHLVTGLDQETRDTFDRDLYAPPAGWAETQRRVFTFIEGEVG